MSKAVLPWWDKQKIKAIALAARMREESSDTCIHDFRVVIKKMRALAFAGPQGKEQKKLFPNLKQVYTLSGNLRNAQVLQQKLALLPAWHNKIGIAKKLDSAIEKKRKALQKWLTVKHLGLLKQELVTMVPVLIEVNKARGKVITPGPAVGQWHECRKLTKKLLYQLQALGRSGEWQVLQWLQEALGEWHDWQVCESLLREHKPSRPRADYFLLLQQCHLSKAYWEETILRFSKHQSIRY